MLFVHIVGLIKQFLRDVDWGDVDYLVVDTPPGTSDEHLSVVQYLSNTHVDGAIIITTPQVRIEKIADIVQNKQFIFTILCVKLSWLITEFKGTVLQTVQYPVCQRLF